MKRTERIETVEGLIRSIKDSLESWDTIEANGDRVMTGCMIAHSELLNIMDDVKGA